MKKLEDIWSASHINDVITPLKHCFCMSGLHGLYTYCQCLFDLCGYCGMFGSAKQHQTKPPLDREAKTKSMHLLVCKYT